MNTLTRVLACTLGFSCAAAEFPKEQKEKDLFIDVGTREATSFLGYGWSRPEQHRQTTYTWIKQMEGDVWFDAGEASERELHVRAAPLYLENKTQNIGVYLNNRFITEWVCERDSGYRDFHTRLPVTAMKAGKNRLTFRMGYCRRVANDRRTLALNVDKILIAHPAP